MELNLEIKRAKTVEVFFPVSKRDRLESFLYFFNVIFRFHDTVAVKTRMRLKLLVCSCAQWLNPAGCSHKFYQNSHKSAVCLEYSKTTTHVCRLCMKRFWSK